MLDADSKMSFSRAGYAHITFRFADRIGRIWFCSNTFLVLVDRDEDSIKKGFKKLGPKDFEGKVERGQKRGLQSTLTRLVGRFNYFDHCPLLEYLAEHKVEAELDTDKLQTEVNQFMLEFDRAQIAVLSIVTIYLVPPCSHRVLRVA